MKIIYESDTNIKFEVKTNLGHTHFEIHPDKLASTFTAESDNYRKEYWVLYLYSFGGQWVSEQYSVSAEEYKEVLDFLRAHNVRLWSQDFGSELKPLIHKVINPIMELEI